MFGAQLGSVEQPPYVYYYYQQYTVLRINFDPPLGTLSFSLHKFLVTKWTVDLKASTTVFCLVLKSRYFKLSITFLTINILKRPMPLKLRFPSEDFSKIRLPHPRLPTPPPSFVFVISSVSLVNTERSILKML